MMLHLCQKSIEYLLSYAGPVIRYRLRKEILHDLTASEEERLLCEIGTLPMFRLLTTYVKSNGYIGSGMHSRDNWRGQVLHQTPLQDGEVATRLLAYYRIPKNDPIVANFVAAMRDETILQHEFSYIPPEIVRFAHRFDGLNNGNSLMALIYTMQAMLGYGDDYDDLKRFQQISLCGFARLLALSSLDDMTKFNPSSKRAYNYPYIEADEYFPDIYTLEMLAYTKSWRVKETIDTVAHALNHINRIMKPENNMHIRINGKYVAPCFALVRPIRAFDPNLIDTITYRRVLTEIAMLGVGERVDVLKASVENVVSAIDRNGVLHMNLDQPHNKRYSPKSIEYPTAYVDIRLQEDYKTNKRALDCDLTFWAVELLHLVKEAEFHEGSI
ncbi:MAG: hypothetical protein IJW40_09425 [Clostridia bacterium]|nr:hypothetical protein [Clostridia bacterium]